MKKVHYLILVLIIIIFTAIGLNYFIVGDKHNYLSNKQMVEDVEYIIETLRNNSPVVNGYENPNIDFEKRFIDLKDRVKDCKTSLEFYKAIEEVLNYGPEIGHLSLIDYKMYDYVKNIIELGKKNNLPDLDEKLFNYRYVFDKDVENIYENVLKKEYHYKKDSIDISTSKDSSELNNDNIETKILKKDKIAYIKIKSFGMENVYKDIPKLEELYNEYRNFTDVIIDISENEGGCEDYWINGIVSPNIERDVKYNYYTLFIGGENNLNNLYNKDIKKLEKHPEFSNINKDILDIFEYYIEDSKVIESKTKSKILKGKIWLIVGDKVYSASETLASFSKNNNFATLVGQATNGDGDSIDPFIIKLPNSNFLIRYSGTYKFNNYNLQDGNCRTNPHIITKPGSEISTILEKIRN